MLDIVLHVFAAGGLRMRGNQSTCGANAMSAGIPRLRILLTIPSFPVKYFISLACLLARWLDLDCLVLVHGLLGLNLDLVRRRLCHFNEVVNGHRGDLVSCIALQ